MHTGGAECRAQRGIGAGKEMAVANLTQDRIASVVEHKRPSTAY
jgi:hypothetical protein